MPRACAFCMGFLLGERKSEVLCSLQCVCAMQMLNSSSCCSLQLGQWLLEEQLQQAVAHTAEAAAGSSQQVSRTICRSVSCWLCTPMQRPHQPIVVL
jgi:hypothetical protein